MTQNKKRLYEVALQSVETYTYEIEAQDESEAGNIACDKFSNGELGVDYDSDHWVEDCDVREIEREGQPANEEKCHEHAAHPA